MNFNKSYILSGLVVILVASGFFYYQKNKSEEFRLITDETEMTKFVMTHTQEELDEYRRKVDEIKAEDTFGGKTPEETLRMYIDALKAGDMELASKYFRLEDQERELEELIVLTKEQVDKSLSFIDVNAYKKFCNDNKDECEIDVIFEGENILIARFIKIEQSGLWKLESL
jgi:hypothetical protein